MVSTSTTRIVFLAAILAISWPATACGGLATSLTVEVDPEPFGLNRYVYTLTNLDSSTIPVVDFALAVSPVQPGCDHRTEWLGDHLHAGRCPDRFRIAFRAGGSPSRVRSEFAFTSPLGAMAEDYLITGIDVPNLIIDTNEGQIAAPGRVPSPNPHRCRCWAQGSSA